MLADRIRMGSNSNKLDPDSWERIQRIVRQGLANEYFEVGDQLMSEYDGGEIVWEVIGIDVDTPADSQYQHSMTLQTKDCLHNIQFDSPEPSNTDIYRRSYGNNRYVHSAVKQWLNSDESKFTWKSQHQYDAKPNNSLDLYDGPGFLYRLDPELVAVLGNVRKKVTKPNVDGGGQEEFIDKVFLLSLLEVGLGTEGVASGESVYPFYQGKGGTNRIKNLNDSPMTWLLRSPTAVTNSYTNPIVYYDGSQSNTLTMDARGLSAACVIC